MIRGILLLILSCVVLTLQQTPCTCQQNVSPNVYQSAADLYPLTSAKGIDTTKTPSSDISDIASGYNTLSSPTLLKDKKTSDILAMQTAANAKHDALSVEIDGLLKVQVAVKAEIDLIKIAIDNDCKSLNYIVGSIIDPLNAVDHCTKSLYILSRQQYVDRLSKWLDITINAKLSLKVLYEAYLKVIGIVLSLSKTLDDLLSKCGIGLLCNRGGLLSTLTSPLTSTLTSGLANLVQQISQTQVNLNVAVTSNPDIFVAATVNDLLHNNIRAVLFGQWTKIEQLIPCLWSDIQAIVAEVYHDSSYLLSLIKPQCLGYTLAPSQLLCTGYTDPTSELISLTLTTKITIVDVNVDLTVAAANLADICRVSVLGLTGALCVDAKATVAADGTVVVRISIDQACHNLKSTCYQIPDVVKTCGITSVANSPAVTQGLLTAAQDITPQSTLTSAYNTLVESAHSASSSITDCDNKIKERTDAAISLVSDRVNAVSAVQATQVPSEIAQIARDRCLAYKNENLDILRALLATNLQIKLTAEAKVASCESDLAQAKIDVATHPGVQLYQDRYTACQQAYMDSLRAALQIQVQIDSICETLNAKIGIDVAALDVLTVDVNANLNALVNGVVSLISSLRINIQLKINLIIGRIIDCIIAFRPSCGAILVEILNLEVTTDPTINIKVTIPDVLGAGELISDMRSCHKSIVQAAITLCLGAAHVEVQVADVAVAGVYVYNVIVG